MNVKNFSYKVSKDALTITFQHSNMSAVRMACMSVKTRAYFAQYNHTDAKVEFSVHDLSASVEAAVQFMKVFERNCDLLKDLDGLVEKYKGE